MQHLGLTVQYVVQLKCCLLYPDTHIMLLKRLTGGGTFVIGWDLIFGCDGERTLLLSNVTIAFWKS